MSATMETEKLSAFLDNCRIFSIPGKIFPITCTFGSAIGPKDTQSTTYVKEVWVSVLSDVYFPLLQGKKNLLLAFI